MIGSTSVSANGRTRVIRPRRRALATHRCARSEMVWFGPQLLSGGPGCPIRNWPDTNDANAARAANLKARRLFGQDQIEQSLVACPICAQYAIQLRSLTANHGQLFPLHVRKLPSQSLTSFVFQAGHASSILVTRSTASLLVNSLSRCPNYSNNQMTRMTRLAIRIP
jgi:hypothetical protein